MVKNSPANAGDMGSITDLRRSHIPQSNYMSVITAENPSARALTLTFTKELTLERNLTTVRNVARLSLFLHPFRNI